ncbi:DUF1257 domain-containing protein [Dactylosporangium siamense]|uniref:DUF1257 domain-containing protein n=1 Tax=Dactylosporangium siamense TaxID=685454 RepID=A0A919PYL0_9ACTN|nr:DUF1257 domain-containing protein [Dactylosporangium siamense]GIG53130.1 hypothetical protein Dsi01nite_111710 [Dactylosporangium siamense]
MSHYTRVRTRMREPKLIAEALANLGLPLVEVHDIPQRLIGYRGDTRRSTAEVIVRREHIGLASNDIGFRRTGDGTFEAVISDYDRQTYDADWLGRVSYQYGRAATLQFAEVGGYAVEEEVDDDGLTRMVLRRHI